MVRAQKCDPRFERGSLNAWSYYAKGVWYPNIHHMRILQGDLSRQFDLKTVHHRPAVDGGEAVQLGDQKGIVFRRSKEAEALARWTDRHFLEVERNFAKEWRRSPTRINFDAMVKNVMGHRRPPFDCSHIGATAY